MTTLNMALSDQKLIAAEKVKIASGDIESVFLAVEFDSAWDAFNNRTASFYTSHKATPIEVLLIDNQCTVPAEVLEKAGTLYIGIIGVTIDGGAVKTSSIASFKIVQGAEHSHTTLNPTLDLYQQYLAAMNQKLDPIQEALAETIKKYKAELDVEYKTLKSNLSAEYESLTAQFIKACDFSRVIKTMTLNREDNILTSSWTATEDCWLSVYVLGSFKDEKTELIIDGVKILSVYTYTYSTSSEVVSGVPPCIYVKKGAVIEFNFVNELYVDEAWCKAYGCLQ